MTRWLVQASILLILVFLSNTAQNAEARAGRQFNPALARSGTRGSIQLNPQDAWPTYGYDNAHDNFNPTEILINPSTASSLKQIWASPGLKGISDQAIVAGTNVYWGSWDGYLHATDVTTNATIWKTYLGQSEDPHCNPPLVGVASSPAVATVNGRLEVFVGGGDANFYALDAMTGHILWKTSFGAPNAGGHYIWSSPTIYNNNIYIGSASFGDCPLTVGQLLQLNIINGRIMHVFNASPPNCIGGGIWSTATIDEQANIVYVTTGTPPTRINKCPGPGPYSPSLVALNASDVSKILHTWEVPKNQQLVDPDFGTTPTLFTASDGTPMVGAANKNGIYYAFKRANLSLVWQKQIAIGGSCPQCGSGSISSSAWDGQTLYVAGGNVVINNVKCQGSIDALNPDTGGILWQQCLRDGPVLGSVTVAGSADVEGEVVAVGEGGAVVVLDASVGTVLAHLSDNKRGSFIYGTPTITNGILYAGNIDGFLYAYAPQV